MKKIRGRSIFEVNQAGARYKRTRNSGRIEEFLGGLEAEPCELTPFEVDGASTEGIRIHLLRKRRKRNLRNRRNIAERNNAAQPQWVLSRTRGASFSISKEDIPRLIKFLTEINNKP